MSQAVWIALFAIIAAMVLIAPRAMAEIRRGRWNLGWLLAWLGIALGLAVLGRLLGY